MFSWPELSGLGSPSRAAGLARFAADCKGLRADYGGQQPRQTGAIAGIRLKESRSRITAAAPVQAAPPAQSDSARQTDVRTFFHGRSPPGDNGSARALRTQWGRAASSWISRSSSSDEDRRSARPRKSRAGSMQLPHIFAFAQQRKPVSKDLLTAMEAWKARIPETGPRLQRPFRWTVAGTAANMQRPSSSAEQLGVIP